MTEGGRGAPAPGAGKILVVDDDRAVTQALVRYLAGTRICVTARTFHEGLDRIVTGAGSYCGFIIDERLPDGRGVELLRAARERAPSAPAMVLTAYVDPIVMNAAYALGGSCVAKPIGPEELRRFVAEAVATELNLDDTLRRRVVAFARRSKLTAAATEILVAKVAGYTTDDILALRAIGANTYRTHVKQILERTKLETLEDVRREVLGSPPPKRTEPRRKKPREATT